MKLCVKIVTCILMLTVVFGIISCTAKQKKTLIIGTSAEYPPFEYKEGQDFKGFDIEVAQLIAKKMGLEPQIQDMEFDSLIPALTSQKIDIAIAAITIKPDRQQQVDFSEPYYQAFQAILIPKTSKVTVSTEADLAKLKVGAQNGTTGQIYITDTFIKTNKMPADNLKKYSTNIEAVTDLLNGNLDVVVMDNSAADAYTKVKDVQVIYTIKTNENYGIAFPKNSPLYEKANAALKEIMNSPEWNQLLTKYFVEEPKK